MTAAASFSPRIEITGEIGRIQNVTSPSVRRLVETITGPPSFDNFDLPLRAEALVWCGRGGVRLRVTEAVRIAPYLALDGGVARVSPAVKLVSTPQFPIPQIPDFAIRAPTVTSGLVGAGAGILRPLGARILFELGYRYTRILTEDHISVHQARAGLEYRF